MHRSLVGIAAGLAAAILGCEAPAERHCDDGCDEAAGGIAIAATTEMPPGDPAAGRDYLIDGDYIQGGIPDVLFPLAKPLFGDLANGPGMPGRASHNADLPYFLTRHDNTGTGVEIVSETCLLCHAAPLRGEIVIGLGDARRDFTVNVGKLAKLIPDIPTPSKTHQELNKLIDRLEGMTELTTSPSLGTNPADSLVMALMGRHDVNTLSYTNDQLLPPPAQRVPVDVPPWWTLHKKTAVFYGATGLGRDFRGTMILATLTFTDDPGSVGHILDRFVDVQAWLMTLRAPRYPFAIDAALAATGKTLFADRCQGCHGTYADTDDDETFPNLLIPVDDVGTDPLAADGFFQRPDFVDWFDRSPYGALSRQEIRVAPRGYVAQPLDGIWATAPYLHNASVPDLAGVLRSQDRPARWTRSDFTNDSYDQARVGFTSRPLSPSEADDLDDTLVYDTSLPGQSSRGHTYSDDLTDAEVAALLEYLKTL